MVVHMAQRRKPAAPPVAVAPEGGQRIERAIREQQRLLAAAAAALDAAGMEDVHHGRVAARRLRSMLKTFGPLFEPRRARLYRVDLRSFARSLAGVREADVRRELLLALLGDAEGIDLGERRQLEVLLEDLCIEARESMRRHLREPGWMALRRALERHAASDGLFLGRDADLGRVMRLAKRSWRRPVRLLEGHPATAAELHELRLALKHIRYALEPLADVAPRPTARLVRRLRAAQDRIGEHRDTLLAGHWVRLNERRLGRALTARLAAVLAKDERRLRRQAAASGRKLLPPLEAWRKATRKLRKASKPARA